jgi:hypothetical protein
VTWKIYEPLWPFGKITLTDGSTQTWRPSFASENFEERRQGPPFMRRRMNGQWQYRRMTVEERSNYEAQYLDGVL